MNRIGGHFEIGDREKVKEQREREKREARHRPS